MKYSSIIALGAAGTAAGAGMPGFPQPPVVTEANPIMAPAPAFDMGGQGMDANDPNAIIPAPLSDLTDDIMRQVGSQPANFVDSLMSSFGIVPQAGNAAPDFGSVRPINPPVAVAVDPLAASPMAMPIATEDPFAMPQHDTFPFNPQPQPVPETKPVFTGESGEFFNDVSSIIKTMQGLAGNVNEDVRESVHKQVEVIEGNFGDMFLHVEKITPVNVADTMCDVVKTMNLASEAAADNMQKFGQMNGLGPLAPPPTVSELNMDQYMGRWYQVASSRFARWTFERDSKCVVTDYANKGDGNFLVRNSMQDVTDNIPQIIEGTATPRAPGKIRVQYDGPMPESCAVRSQWVVAVGPVVKNQYEWAIVSGPFHMSLFVLARDPTTYANKYAADVKTALRSLGFSRFLSKPVPTIHDSTCSYPAPLLEAQPTPVSSLPQSSIVGEAPAATVTQTYTETAKVTMLVTPTQAPVAATMIPTVAVTQVAPVSVVAATTVAAALAPARENEIVSAAAQAAPQETVANESSGLSVGVIVAIALAAAAALLLCCLAGLCFWRRRKQQKVIILPSAAARGCSFCGKEKCNHNEEKTKSPEADTESVESEDEPKLFIPTYDEATRAAGANKNMAGSPSAQALC